MAIQRINLGTAPSGTGGDTNRSAFTKIDGNFADTTNAASRLVGTAAGNVMEVGAFGIGGGAVTITNTTDFTELMSKYSGVYKASGSWPTVNAPHSNGGTALVLSSTVNISSALILPYGKAGANRNAMSVISRYFAETPIEQIVYTSKNPIIANTENTATSGKLVSVLSTGELQSIGFSIDANGFIKKASPIVRLFADKIEVNDEAEEQGITFEKLGVGDYLVKGSLGFAQEGWYIEMPKDANGNVLVAVFYEQLENNDISVKTYAKKFDEETGDIVANTAKPRDIPTTRWIDLRLQALPQPDIKPFSTDETVTTNAE
ncbi:hypothetical protein HG532_00735 [Moraxella osloensis]|nr:hypothetical protein [Moraxella osloensis]MBW4008556.1 hypothetical protein [Moraxella osloensis]